MAAGAQALGPSFTALPSVSSESWIRSVTFDPELELALTCSHRWPPSSVFLVKGLLKIGEYPVRGLCKFWCPQRIERKSRLINLSSVYSANDF